MKAELSLRPFLESDSDVDVVCDRAKSEQTIYLLEQNWKIY